MHKTEINENFLSPIEYKCKQDTRTFSTQLRNNQQPEDFLISHETRREALSVCIVIHVAVVLFARRDCVRFAFSAVNSINASKSRTLASFLRLQSKELQNGPCSHWRLNSGTDLKPSYVPSMNSCSSNNYILNLIVKFAAQHDASELDCSWNSFEIERKRGIDLWSRWHFQWRTLINVDMGSLRFVIFLIIVNFPFKYHIS